MEAIAKQGGEVTLAMNFREDGSIRTLHYINPYCDYKLTLSTDKHDNTVTAYNYFKDGIFERTFQKTDDDTLELIR